MLVSKRLIIMFLALMGIFLGTWWYKIETPVPRPDEYAEGVMEDAGAYWIYSGSVSAEEDWKLDPTIEPDYIPVPGEENLFMQVDKEGNILKYRKRIKQIDGTWLWKDVNPDIPDDYEPVEGLENVYKVTGSDGTVKYLKYIRNQDDTFAFVEVDENGEMVGRNKDAQFVDSKHVHISGNIYRLLDDNGVSIGYEKRIMNDDGTFTWVTQQYDLDDINDQLSLENTSLGNEDDTLTPTGVIDGLQDNPISAAPDEYNITINEGSGMMGTQLIPDQPMIINNSDGTHTEVIVTKETKVIDGYKTTYETTIEKTYDAAGNLVSSSDPITVEVGTPELALTVGTDEVKGDTSKVLDSLSAEYKRVCGNFTYYDDVAAQAVAELNAQRGQKALAPLSQTDNATMIAKLRAADMAQYDNMNEALPTYGVIAAMVAKYKLDTTTPGENMWRTMSASAEDIDTRFMTVDSSRKTRMRDDISQIGIAVCEHNGYYYIVEVVL